MIGPNGTGRILQCWPVFCVPGAEKDWSVCLVCTRAPTAGTQGPPPLDASGG